MVAVAVFAKSAHAVPMKSKTPEEVVPAMKELLNKIGIPKQIYHDNEGSFSSVEFIRLVNSHKIKQIITSSPAPFVERLILTLNKQSTIVLRD